MKKLLFGLIITLALTACSSVSEPTPQPAPLIATPHATPAESASPSPTVDIAPEAPSSVNTFPDTTQYFWVPIAKGFEQPLDIQNAGDGSNRLFIVERGGKIRILENYLLVDEPFLYNEPRKLDHRLR